MSLSWRYADAMQAEADKREKEDAEKKHAEMREILNSNNTFIEKEGQHFDDVEWKPDWSQAPDAKYWAMDGNGSCYFYKTEPEIVDDEYFDFGEVLLNSGDFGYQGDWRNSLRKRPE